MKKYKHRLSRDILDCIYEDNEGALLENRFGTRFWRQSPEMKEYYEEYKEPVTIIKYTFVWLGDKTNKPVMSSALWTSKEDLLEKVGSENIEIVEIKWESK